MNYFTDDRGTLYFPIKNNNFKACECTVSKNKSNVFRGFHKNDFDKLVTVISGKILDFMIVENKVIRTILPEGTQLLVPKGIPHAFLTLEESTIIYHFNGSFGETVQINWSKFDIPEINNQTIMNDRDYRS